jgi:beta-galactosidase
VAHPRFWEPDDPHLYRVTCTLLVDHVRIDSTDAPLGIRVLRWNASTGLALNGRPLKLHGWGQRPTDEWPGLGAALPDWLHEFTLRLMKEAGGNFLRWGHSAAGAAQIAASDRLGIIVDQPGVDGESDTRGAAWTLRASAFRDLVLYFRNNPSILIWEGGNQKVSREHARELRAIVDRYDPHGGRVYAHRRADQVTADVMDVGIGTEGGREIAALPVLEGEYDREESPRRVWDDASPPRFGYPEAKGQTYQLTSEQFAVNQVAQYVNKLGVPGHSGGANWIFSDSTSGGRVAVEVARASGEVDGVRLPKEAYFAVAAMFRNDPRVHIIGHWTYPAATRKTVYVVSNAEEVELLVNGTSVGRAKPTDRYLFTFADVRWQPGEIKAVARSGGEVVATQTKRTAGAPVALRVTAITAPGGLRADGSDIALFDVEAVDARGERCPTVETRVDFTTKGPGVWRGGYNSGKIDSINNRYLDLEAGIARVSVRATRSPGVISVRATSPGLRTGEASVTASAFGAEEGTSMLMPAVAQVALPRLWQHK